MADRGRSPLAAIRPLRIGVIGVGSIGRVHARLLADDPDCLLVALADPTPAGGELAAELGVTWYRDHETLLAKESLDGVVVAVPTALHASVGLACVSAGVHMLMEKPITDELLAGRDLVSAAEVAGVRIVVGHHRRFDPAVKRAREIIAGGELGRLVLVSAIWAARKPDDYWQAGWRSAPGGGPILINLIHDLDCLRHICGEIVEVSAASSRAIRGFEVEDTAAIVLQFANGALGTVAISDATVSPWSWEGGTNDNPVVAWSGQNSYRFMGTSGSLEFPNLVTWRNDGEHSWGSPFVATPVGLGPRTARADLIRHFAAVIRGDEPSRIDGRDGLATLAATLAVRDAASSGRPVVPVDVRGGGPATVA
jgi:predicted dehydrogenase